MRRLFVVVFALALVLAACSGDAGPSTTVASSETTTTMGSPVTTVGTESPSTSEIVPSTTTGQPAGPTTATINADDPDPELVDSINELIVITEETRGLEFLRSPLVSIVTEAELAERVAALIAEELEPEESARDDALYEALGIISPSVDLETLFIELYSEQVAGFYDGDTEEMVVPASDGELSALQKLTMVHELTHALTDQHFEFNDHFNRLYDEDRFDEATALSGLLEGDATWTELIYFQQGMSVTDQRAVLEESLEIDTSALDQTPSFIADSLIWPYDLDGGTGFVSALWSETGDFTKVNAVYGAYPTTTEQVIDISAYEEGETGLPVELLATPVPGYEVGEESTWGEQSYGALFDQSLSERTAGAAADGWGGDRYRVLWNGAEVVFVSLYVGDTPSDAEEMYDAWSELKAAQIPSDRFVFIGWAGDEVLVIVADDDTAGETALEPYRSIFAD